jgi:hypothetical protein
LKNPKKDPDLARALKKFSPDTDLIDKLLFLYIDRCKLVYSLAFMQYRRRLPDCAFTDIMMIFKERQQYLIDLLNASHVAENTKLFLDVDSTNEALAGQSFIKNNEIKITDEEGNVDFFAELCLRA